MPDGCRRLGRIHVDLEVLRDALRLPAGVTVLEVRPPSHGVQPICELVVTGTEIPECGPDECPLLNVTVHKRAAVPERLTHSFERVPDRQMAGRLAGAADGD